MSPPILCDLTSLVASPGRSGIQRVTRQALRHWPDAETLLPCAFDNAGRLRLLSRRILPILCSSEETSIAKIEDERRALAALERESRDLPEGAPRRLLNLELFYEQSRAEAYMRLANAGWQVRFLVYDFLPWLHPELFPIGTTQHCMHYLRALSCADVAFISAQTQREYVERVTRRRHHTGPVLSLGADGLGLERQSWSPERRNIVAIGTIEQRKNPECLIEAMYLLWERGVDARLTMAGRIDERYRPILAQLTRDGAGRVTILEQPTDEMIRSVLRGARAVVCTSEVEGFGLPPYESIFSGIPVIAAVSLPSMQLVPSRGHILLLRIHTETLTTAIAAVYDNMVAERLWQEASNIALPTWRDFSRALAAWAAA